MQRYGAILWCMAIQLGSMNFLWRFLRVARFDIRLSFVSRADLMLGTEIVFAPMREACMTLVVGSGEFIFMIISSR